MLTAAFWLSLVLAVAGCAGLVLAGRGNWYGWAIGIAVQPVWIAFGVITHGYGLCLTAVMYAAVYTGNLLRWRGHPPTATVTDSDIEAVTTVTPVIIRGPRDLIARLTIIPRTDDDYGPTS